MQQVGITTFVHIATTVYAYRYLDIYALYVLIRHPISFGWFVRESNEKTNRWSVRFASYQRLRLVTSLSRFWVRVPGIYIYIFLGIL